MDKMQISWHREPSNESSRNIDTLMKMRDFHLFLVDNLPIELGFGGTWETIKVRRSIISDEPNQRTSDFFRKHVAILDFTQPQKHRQYRCRSDICENQANECWINTRLKNPNKDGMVRVQQIRVAVTLEQLGE
jgi:hypothetical protein